MKAISDTRRLRIYRSVVVDGEVRSDQSADAWQDSSGYVRVAGLWDGVLVSSAEDLCLQAHEAMVSPLELLRLRLLRCPAIRVEVIH
jgi:hypothetical protein